MNPNYAARVKEEIDKLLKAGFIRLVKQATWLSPIVVVPKKNGKIRVYVEYRKLNAVTVTDTFRYLSPTAYWMQSSSMTCTIF